MSQNDETVLSSIQGLLEKDYRGVNIAVYAVATAGLAFSIHKIRPVSKFSKASKVPEHFFRKNVPLLGTCSGVQHSPVRVLVNHKAPIYLPLWHSSKPPLPVKLWGVDVVSGNAVSWLDCVAKGKQVTLKPITRENDDLVSTVLLHLPHPAKKKQETVDLGNKLVELGFAKASLPKAVKKNSIESKLASEILSAEARAKAFRNGIWSDVLAPTPSYVVYWRKGSDLTVSLLILTSKKFLSLLVYLTKSGLIGMKKLALLPFKKETKQVQTT